MWPAPTARPPRPPSPATSSPTRGWTPPSWWGVGCTCWAPTPGSAAPSTWWPRPTSTTARSSPSTRCSPSSPTSRQSTWTPTAPSRPWRRRFVAFCNRTPFYGATIACLDDPGVRRLLPRLGRRIVTYGESPQAEVAARAVVAGPGGSTCRVAVRGVEVGVLQVPMPGRHVLANALAATAAALEVGVGFDAIAGAIASFTGVARRFERKGERDGAVLVDDYAHHPTEVAATLAGSPPGVPGRAHHRGVPAASLLPHGSVRPPVRRGPPGRRRGTGAPHLPRPRATRGGRHPPPGVRSRPRLRPPQCPHLRLVRRGSWAPWPIPCGPATWS